MALLKISLQAFADAQFTQKAGAAYSVLNPESFVQKSDYASQGKLDISLLLDGTRAIDGKQIEVSCEIAALRSLAFAYHGQIRSPYYVQVTWSSFVFQGRLTTFNVTYTLFRPDGTPVQAKVDLSFVSLTDNPTLPLLADNQPSDLMR